MGRAVELPGVDMFPTSRALLVGHGWCQMATDVLDHQFTDGLIVMVPSSIFRISFFLPFFLSSHLA